MLKVNNIREKFIELYQNKEIAENGTIEIINASFISDEETKSMADHHYAINVSDFRGYEDVKIIRDAIIKNFDDYLQAIYFELGADGLFTDFGDKSVTFLRAAGKIN